jgi:amidase
MPTTPTIAPKLPASDAPFEQRFVPGFETIANTAPFDVSGHPAMSVPCGAIDGLPVGLMLVGRRWDECSIYRAATAFSST